MKKNCVLALGFFDSIHLGHIYLIGEGLAMAKKKNSDFVLVTFDDDFLASLGRKEDEVFLLSERRNILKKLGVNNVEVLPSNVEFISYSKSQFLDYIAEFLPTGIIVGKDYKFAKNASGNIKDLCEYFDKKGIDVKVCDLMQNEMKKIATTDIRLLLKNGDIEKANSLLSEKFFYSGTVINGKKNGRAMGYPTINLDISKDKIKIKSGVYVTHVNIDNESYLSVTNVGNHPTFNDEHFNVETHILGQLGDLYGKKVEIYFDKYIREIIAFENSVQLGKQIQQDIDFAKEVKND